MATILERPRSALSDAHTIIRQRRPSIVEVIDVDQIIDVDQLDEMVPSTSSRLVSVSRAQPEVIVIDSDDEDPPHQEASGSTRLVQRRARLRSPPPPPVAGPSRIPPVPAVPRQYSIFSGLTRSALDMMPPVIRPIDRRFEFEAEPLPGLNALHLHPNRHRRPLEQRAEARPHHLELGGAILATNEPMPNANSQRNRNRRHLHNHINDGQNQPGLINRAMRRFYTTFARISPDFEDFEPDDLFGERPVRRTRGFGSQERHQEEVGSYKSEYTHPGQAESGFSFNFAPPEPLPTSKTAPVVIDLVGSDSEDAPVAGPSKQNASVSPTAAVTLLVCARCLDPLLLGNSMVGEEGRLRKVWALRCGHMIDGKCLDILGLPLSENDRGEGGSSQGNGKGKVKEDEDPDSTDTEVLIPTENTIRTRLRSRVPPPPVPATMMAPYSSAASTTILGKRKRRTKHSIEATYEWKCPVASCGRIHASVKIDGAWIQERPREPVAKGKGKRPALEGLPGRGAIPVFV